MKKLDYVNYSIYGTVRGNTYFNNDTPMYGVKVTITGPKGYSGSVTTDSSGEFVFVLDYTGKYSLKYVV